MTYEEFKKELRWNVQNMETARGKTIRLLERHMVCGDPMAVHIMNIMNRCMYGREQIMNASISVVCYKSKTLSNGEHPLMFRISKDDLCKK